MKNTTFTRNTFQVKAIVCSIFLSSTLFLNAQSAGIFSGTGENNGKSFSMGTDAATATVQKIAKAYSAKDVNLLMTNYSEEFAKNAYEGNKKWLESMTTIVMDPYMIIPVKMEGSEDTMVLTWSVEDRNSANGSKEKLNLMEIFTVDKDHKVNNFSQWVRKPETNEFGLNYGGKFIGDGTSEYSGSALVFSNRGEVEAIEKLVENYNKMDGKACATAFTKDAVLVDSEGNKYILDDATWAATFNDYKEVSWKISGILPVKIQNTDPESGVTVYSREKRVFKDGTVWEKELVEQFYFNMDGKISKVDQYARNIPKK